MKFSIIIPSWNNLDYLKICKIFKTSDHKVYQYMQQNHFVSIFNKIQNNTKNKSQFITQFHNWFDSLKIYKFLKMYVKN